MTCSCGGRIVVTTTERQGETAHCERCQRCVTLGELLAEVDGLRDSFAGYNAELHAAALKENDRLRAEVERLQAIIDGAVADLEFAASEGTTLGHCPACGADDVDRTEVLVCGLPSMLCAACAASDDADARTEGTDDP